MTAEAVTNYIRQQLDGGEPIGVDDFIIPDPEFSNRLVYFDGDAPDGEQSLWLITVQPVVISILEEA